MVYLLTPRRAKEQHFACFEKFCPTSRTVARQRFLPPGVNSGARDMLRSIGFFRIFFRHLQGFVLLAVFGLAAAQMSLASETAHVALIGQTKHGSTLSHFDYADPDAPKGGTVRQGTRVTFDTTNGMRFPGKMPNELTYIYDTLMVRAEDEPASFYGLLAERLDVAPDYSRIAFQIRETARWHDGTALTAFDVKFTFETVAQHGLPGYRSLLEDVQIIAPSAHQIIFEAESADWRLFELVASFPIFQASFWQSRDVSQMTLDQPVGSGPYKIARLDLNTQTILERVPDYWAVDLPVNQGRWNFDRIITDYYFDTDTMVEALRGGQIDVNREWNPSEWLKGYDGPALRDGRIVKRAVTNPRGARYESLVFNLRRPPLDDRRVRTALSAVFDGDFVRDSFYGGLFTPPMGHFSGTKLAPVGPVTEGERALLDPFRNALPEGIFDTAQPPDFHDLSQRERLRIADQLLQEAGYVIRDGVRVNAATNEPLALEFVGANASDRDVLQYYAFALSGLGITLDVRYFDYVLGSRMILNHEWDITSLGGRTRYPPGSDERLLWHSERARVPGYALAGAEDPALDLSIEKMTSAANEEDLVSAARAFSRVLGWQRYMLDIAQIDQIWFVHRKEIGFPENFVPGDFHYLSTLFKQSVPD